MCLDADTDGSSTPQPITTVMVQPITSRATAEGLVEEVDSLGFKGAYDYLYLPLDSRGNKGYFFINFTEPADCRRFSARLVQQVQTPLLARAEVREAKLQGVDSNLQHLWTLWRGISPAAESKPFIRENGELTRVLPWEVLPAVHDPEESSAMSLMIRGIPNKLSSTDLMDEFDCLGFEGQYDYFYLPCDARSYRNKGYAFVNLLTADVLQKFSKVMDGYRFAQSQSAKQVHVSRAKYQGVKANLQRISSVNYADGLLAYPWVQIDHQMKCLRSKTDAMACIARLDGVIRTTPVRKAPKEGAVPEMSLDEKVGSSPTSSTSTAEPGAFGSISTRSNSFDRKVESVSALECMKLESIQPSALEYMPHAMTHPSELEAAAAAFLAFNASANMDWTPPFGFTSPPMSN